MLRRPRSTATESSHGYLTVRTHAALVLEGDQCVGWCQFGPPEEVPRIKNRAAYEKELSDLPDWRIACRYVGKVQRRQGAASAGLFGALMLIAGLGGGLVEGYPEDAASVSAGFLFHGALSTYDQLGFTPAFGPLVIWRLNLQRCLRPMSSNIWPRADSCR